jgi:arylsulfatase A
MKLLRLLPLVHRLTSALLPLLTALEGASAVTPEPKPNLVFILADDLGFAEIGCNGADAYKTPNIDALAKSGARFSHFYTAPLCGPSRALILTGRYGFRTGAVTQDACGAIARTGDKAEIMLPTILKRAGYTTAMIGKWGQLSPSGDAAQWGFDHVMSFKSSGIYWNRSTAKTLLSSYPLEGEKGTSDGVRAEPGPYTINGKIHNLADNEYLPDLLHKNAMEFIVANTAKSQPFFLYYSLSHVHGQILPTPDSGPANPSHNADQRLSQVYKDNIAYTDKLVGNLIAELERLKIRKNTMIVFMGDNGTAKAHADHATIGGQRLVGQKGEMTEGGGLVPMIANWPGKITSGKLEENVADASDLLPTFAEAAGAPLPEARVFDGKSLLYQLTNNQAPARSWIFNQLGAGWYVREAAWKLNEKGELFDMSDAPFKETLIPASSSDASASAARLRLGEALAQLNPEGGIKGEGSGRGDKSKKEDKKKAAKSQPGV